VASCLSRSATRSDCFLRCSMSISSSSTCSQQTVVLELPLVVEEPALQITLGLIENFRSLIEIGKHGLHDVFRLANIVNDARRDAHDQAIVAIENHSHSLLIVGKEAPDQLAVGDFVDGLFSEWVRFPVPHPGRALRSATMVGR
jgi:hypothetical protein